MASPRPATMMRACFISGLSVCGMHERSVQPGKRGLNRDRKLRENLDFAMFEDVFARQFRAPSLDHAVALEEQIRDMRAVQDEHRAQPAIDRPGWVGGGG